MHQKKIMAKEFWLNLPVKDLKKSKEFFSRLGFAFNEHLGDREDLACMLLGDNRSIVMLFPETTFKGFTQNELANEKTTEVMMSIDAESREEVDEMARKAEAAGSVVFGKPSESQGWLYGCAFTDLDGHRWNILYRDMSKLKGQKGE